MVEARGGGLGVTTRLFTALSFAVALLACQPAGDAGARSSSPPTTAAAAQAKALDPARLVGSWMRTDSEYVIVIESAAPDGKLVARYMNPQPIHVSKAQWMGSGSRLTLMVEMQDRGYPGSFYELDYDVTHDTLFGTYHHLGLHQDFQVSFYRLKKEGAAP